MSNSVFPDPASAGGVVYRDAAGNCLLPVPDIHNAHCPLPGYRATCDITALPSNCDARIEPRQVNAIVSELIAFAECLDPNGLWDCDSLKNLCAAFTAWALINVSGVIVSDNPPPPGTKDNILWWESDSGNLFINYNDGNSTQWVQVAGTPVMDNVSIVGIGTTTSPHAVGLVDCGTWS